MGQRVLVLSGASDLRYASQDFRGVNARLDLAQGHNQEQTLVPSSIHPSALDVNGI